MGVKLFVWDFHGVLEKHNEQGVRDIVNRVFSEFEIDRKATVKECSDLYGKKWHHYFRYFVPDANEELLRRLVTKAGEISISEKPGLKYIKPTEHAHHVLDEIKKKGHTNIIASNSSPGALKYFLESVQMSNIFEHEFAADGHVDLQSTKEAWLKKFLLKNNFEKIIVIDDIHDGIEMGKRIGAVTYHFRHDKKFDSSNADYQITDLREVLKEV